MNTWIRVHVVVPGTSYMHEQVAHGCGREAGSICKLHPLRLASLCMMSSVASVAVWVALVWGHGQEGSWSEVIQYVNIKPARLRLT